MKPAARIQSAIEILDSIFEGSKPADTIITDYFKARRYAGSKDRRNVTNRVYHILRNRAKFGWLCDQVELEHSARNMLLCDCLLDDQPLDDLFNAEQYAPASLTELEKNALSVLAEFDLNNAPQHVRLEYPQWLEKELQDSLGDDLHKALDALNTEAPLDLRINHLHPEYARASEILRAEQMDVEKTPYSPFGLRSQKKVKMGGIKAYKDGLVDIQDEGSQLIALLSAVKDQELVMDFCAGAGGKTLAMAAEMNNKGILYALDIAAKRLFKMNRRLDRAGVNNVILHPINTEQDPWLKQFEGRVDRLLIDAPCSGIGAWRRSPESRWKLTADLLKDLQGRQERILQTAAHLVKPGGRLIYATCSLLKSENERQVEIFLEAHPKYSLKSIQDVWEEQLGTPCPFDTPYMTLRPDLHVCDGFFCAVLEHND